MHILIAGAGIGGLTTALCLLNSGHSVTVLEQAQAITPVGAGLQLGANALKVLAHVGVMDALKPSVVSPQAIEFRDGLSGVLLAKSVLGTSYERKFGAPYWHVHRADLYQVLLDELLRLDPKALKLGHQVIDFAQDDSEVTVQTNRGEHFIGDCFIGSDGVRSLIRRRINPGSSARYTGNVAWRILVERDALPKEWMQPVVTNFVGPGRHAILYYVNGGRAVNLVGVVEQKLDVSESDSWMAKGSWQRLHDDFAGWHPQLQAVINAVDKDECYRWALYDQAPSKFWCNGRVALLGDAAHATLPFMAAGAAMAIEDARIIERALNSHVKVSTALLSYQNTRYARTAKVQSTSARLGKLYHLEHSMLRRIAFAGFAAALRAQESFLPSYNANSMALSS